MNSDASLRLHFWQRRTLPMLLQTEAAECAIASLAMVASYWGHRIDLASMRRRFPVSLKGSSLKSLIATAQALGLQTRPLRLEPEQLADLQLPCILHWDLNHFVVLASLRGSHAVVHDPGFGARRLSLDELSRHFTGVVLELVPGGSFREAEASQRYTLQSLLGRVVGLRHGMAQLLVLAAALQVCALVAPFYLQWTIDEALVAADRDLVTVLALGFLLLAVMQAAITAVHFMDYDGARRHPQLPVAGQRLRPSDEAADRLFREAPSGRCPVALRFDSGNPAQSDDAVCREHR